MGEVEVEVEVEGDTRSVSMTGCFMSRTPDLEGTGRPTTTPVFDASRVDREAARRARPAMPYPAVPL